ncbi:hypothetical protein MSBRW_1927 [Methanosarcina barkeri str. Wiesmoor]|uniref:Uncharacterized protein n=2 Tax=Methanosarcina barkeri TaxID=2208 RepID=A0A0E3QMI1_METBA|nr:hypothetical protein [Methanosarcina barkeri]AKB51180.1 hypothetical protein MSBRW_1927 [Methanosarcina barkeri str. Wiesmoor]
MHSCIKLLETSVKRYEESRNIFTPRSLDYARATMNMGDALQKLANLGINEKDYLETAVRLYDEAREILSPISSDYALVTMNQGNALQRLAELRISNLPYVINSKTVNAKISLLTPVNSVSSSIELDFEKERSLQSFRDEIICKLDVQDTKINRIEESVSNSNKVLSKISIDCNSIKSRVEKGFEGNETELKKLQHQLDYVNYNLEDLMQISNKVSGKEAECLRKFISQFSELTNSGKYDMINDFLEKIIQHETSLKEIIEKSDLPEKEKQNARSKISSFKKIPGLIKKKTKSFSVDVTKDVVVTLTSNEIIKLLAPVLTTAAFGVPIPSKVVEILLEAIGN